MQWIFRLTLRLALSFLTVKYRANGKELQKDLMKLSVWVKKEQRNTNADKHERMHLGTKLFKYTYNMMLEVELVVRD